MNGFKLIRHKGEVTLSFSKHCCLLYSDGFLSPTTGNADFIEFWSQKSYLKKQKFPWPTSRDSKGQPSPNQNFNLTSNTKLLPSTLHSFQVQAWPVLGSCNWEEEVAWVFCFSSVLFHFIPSIRVRQVVEGKGKKDYLLGGNFSLFLVLNVLWGWWTNASSFVRHTHRLFR